MCSFFVSYVLVICLGTLSSALPGEVGCNGDANASIRERLPACPSTCKHPNEEPCDKLAPPVGCVCNYGYILSEPNGRCIKLESCPGGHPCGANETFSLCRFDCPTEFCPVDDQFPRMVCDQPLQCQTGCVCKQEYMWKSKKDRTCILPQKCPEVPCTKPNEEWDKCPSPCFPDMCNQPNLSPEECSAIHEHGDPKCEPGCICTTSNKRHPESLLCIPAQDCRTF